MRVSERFGCPTVVGAVVGLELEVEGQRLPSRMPTNSAWLVKPDGSLRNGLEYVFNGPMGAVRTKAALEELDATMKASGFIPAYSFRTSTHVHVNVSNLDEEIAKVMVCMFHLFEDEYINFCARGRKANRFCLNMKDADGVLDNISLFLRQNDVPGADRGKYSALNLCTMASFGTLEFRSLEGTNDWERIYLWVRALLALRKAAKDVGTRKKLFDMDFEEMAAIMFPTPRLKTFLKEGWQQRVALNHSIGYTVFMD